MEQISIDKNVVVSGDEIKIILNFIDTEGEAHEAEITRKEDDPNYWALKVDGKVFNDDEKNALKRPVGNFLFCEPADNGGDITFNGKDYHCHEVKGVLEGSFLLGNHTCPFFLESLGMEINL